MSNFNRFMKQNKVQKENTTYPATKSLTDEKGNPLLWSIKPLTTRENDAIREDCTMDVPVTGKPNMFRPKVNTSKYIAKMICAAVIEPNLNDKELQDSYGVMTPEELLKEMVDDPGEYGDFANFVQQFNGFTTTMDDKVEEAKN
ncbi:phage tail assembly chaperone [Lachnoclostridium phytofermentans]|uniref:XkdN-like protein n=1 Tax=Lachnoclostridium phytofermentans (strain ATCC 700394 / DSM 18823 / ISDg) TaxID=357809 RepID=A9KPN9_LACP7|nr:hypothetical protein [Lachnoclostridium phytofermentans]ABX43313.1 XkdN-like protein [Lachnoclostridium phytofermentans ISDg]